MIKIFQIKNLNYLLTKNLFVFLLLIVQACSNTEIGSKLSSSFDSPDQETLKIDTSKTIENKNKADISKNDQKLIKDNTPSLLKKNKNISPNDNKIHKKKNKIINKNNIPYSPKPYRIILKLSGANPSAPAETVTRALRQAGVEFEVEKIESFDEQLIKKR